MRNAAKLIGAGAAALGALALLTSVHAAGIDAAADVLLIGALLILAHTVFRLVDEFGQMPPAAEGEGASRDRKEAPLSGRKR